MLPRPRVSIAPLEAQAPAQARVLLADAPGFPAPGPGHVAAHVQRLPAGHQHRELGAGLQKVFHKLGAGGNQVLAVVQQ